MRSTEPVDGRQTESADSDTFHRLVADVLPELVWVERATDLQRTYANRQFDAFFGDIGPSRSSLLDRCHSEDRQALDGAWLRAEQRHGTFTTQARMLRKDGRYRWHKLTAVSIRRDGEADAWICTAVDIDDVVSAREQLRDTTNLLRLSLNAAGAGTWLYSVSTGRVSFSAEAAKMHGLRDEACELDVETEWVPMVHRDDAIRTLEDLKTAIETRSPFATQFRIELADGRTRWVSGSGRVDIEPDGSVARVLGLSEDITERKHAEAQLIEARAQADEARHDAEKANVAKTEFLASMSHEIRTPLNGVLGYAEILLDDLALTPAQRKCGERIQSAATSLLMIVNDILDFSKIEAGYIAIKSCAFDIREIVDDARSIVRCTAEQKGLSLKSSVDPTVPCRVNGDPEKIRQVLINLLSNAVKFTSAGQVESCVSTVSYDCGRTALRLAVTDTGIGIPSDQLPKLFKRFSQVDGSLGRVFGGTGLGLAICKSLVELMNGRIGVESLNGQGSTFWFELPLSLAEDQSPGQKGNVAAKRILSGKVLVVDDVEMNRDLARHILTGMGLDIECVADGPSAILAVQEKDFDLVLMDVQMPKMDGISATHEIRSLPTPHCAIPIIAVTANVLPQQVEKCLAAGMNDHIGKPIKRDELFRALRRSLMTPSEPIHPARDHGRSGVAEDTVYDPEAYEKLQELIGAEAMNRLTMQFRVMLTNSLTEDAIVGFDRHRLGALAHTAVGGAALLGFTSFGKLCSALSKACAEDADIDEARRRLLAGRRKILDLLPQNATGDAGT